MAMTEEPPRGWHKTIGSTITIRCLALFLGFGAVVGFLISYFQVSLFYVGLFALTGFCKVIAAFSKAPPELVLFFVLAIVAVSGFLMFFFTFVFLNLF